MADVTSPFAFPYPEETDLVRDGATDIENLATGVNDYLAGGYLYAGTRYYTSSGTFAKADAFGDTSNVVSRAIRVRMVGAGGGGGGASTTGAGLASAGAPGSSGWYAESFITDIAGLDASVTVTRGSAGAGGAAGANSGAAGGNSSFGTLVVAVGGQGGTSFGQTAPPGGQSGIVSTGPGASTGDLVIAGEASSPTYYYAATVIFTPPGPSSILGKNNQAGIATAAGANGSSASANAYGAGGLGGANAQNQGTARTGGAGGDGIVIVDVFV
jgi:hypothetical protein